MKTYNKIDAKQHLQNLKEWKFKNNAIEKNFVFENFSQTLAFIVQVGLLSEKANHHPEIFNIYNKLILTLSTHDANGVTDKDFKLAKEIDDLQ